MKSLIKQLARRIGVSLVSRDHAGVRYLDYPPRSIFDAILLEIFPSIERLNFIQIGANDGIRADPIRHFLLHAHWTGLLVEPVPHLFRSLQAGYAGQAGLQFLNAAVDMARGERAIYYIDPATDGIPDWAHGLASFSEAHVRQTCRSLGIPEQVVINESVPTLPWTDIRAAFGERPCDVLVTDVEGHDLALLAHADLGGWKPTVIHFEHGCARMNDRLSFYETLLGLGYELATAGADTIAYRRRVSPGT